MDLIQVGNNMVSKKLEKEEYSDQFFQSSHWILRMYKYAGPALSIFKLGGEVGGGPRKV